MAVKNREGRGEREKWKGGRESRRGECGWGTRAQFQF